MMVCRWGSFLRPVFLAWISRAQEYHQRFLTATTHANTLNKATTGLVVLRLLVLVQRQSA